MKSQTHSNFEGRCFKNHWHPSFSVHNDNIGGDDQSAPDAQRAAGVVLDDTMAIFLERDASPLVSPDIEDVQRYCEGANDENVESGVGDAGALRNAWLDQRNSPYLNGSGNAREHENPLTATGLFRQLKRPRYNDGDQPDAERRLIYIADPTPAYVFALAATAPFHQVPSLRDGLCKYIGFQPSIRVNTYRVGRLAFNMEFHLPSLALREQPASDDLPLRHGAHGQPLRAWWDLSFLRGQTTRTESQVRYGIYEAQISCVVSGVDDWQWVAYFFIDSDHDGDDSTDRVTADRVMSPQGYREDPISGLNADFPIWNPRLYFLKIFEVRLKQVKEEWHILVRNLFHDIHKYKSAHPFTWSPNSRSARARANAMKESFNWAHQTMDLLSHLRDVLGGICREWETFTKEDDIDFFSDLDEDPYTPGVVSACQSLRNIKETFVMLEKHRQTLISLNDLLNQFSRTLKLRLSLEVSDTAEHNGFTTDFSLWVLYPFALGTSIFSMQPSVIPFDLTPMWYCITVGILMAGMTLIYWVMKRWLSNHKEIPVLTEVTQRDQEVDHLLERIHRNLFSRRVTGDMDVESSAQVMSIMSARRDTF